MPAFTEDPDAWDSYVTLVDGSPAAITLDMAVGETAPLTELPILLGVFLYMNEPGEDGLGSGQDPEALRHVEQSLIHAFESRLHAQFVGRVRSSGVWQLYYYAPKDDDIEEQAASLLSGFSGWEQELHVKSDPEWELYYRLLFPDRERLQWIQDRKVCEALIEEGDTLVIPRRVDHFVYFSSAADRKRFLDAVDHDSFEVEEVGFDPDADDLAYTAQIYRTENVQLETIHEVVMALVEAAAQEDGLYDGWETSVIVPQTERDPLPN